MDLKAWAQPRKNRWSTGLAVTAVLSALVISMAGTHWWLAKVQARDAGDRRRAPDRRQGARRANEMVRDRRRWRAGQPAMPSEAAPNWPWPESSGGSGDGGTGESWSATVTSR